MPETNQSKPTEIVIVLDRSGSMEAIRSDAIGGYNAFIEGQKAEAGECSATLIQFDDRSDIVYQGVPVADVDPLDGMSYVPRGSTALRDAIARGAGVLAERLKGRDALGVLVILTDGEENSSIEVSPEQVRRVLDDCAAKGWGVVYLGANQDAVKVGAETGVAKGMAATFDPGAIRGSLEVATRNVASYRSSGGEARCLAFSDDQRREMAHTASPASQFLTTTQAAAELGVSPSTLRRRAAEGQAPPAVRPTPTSHPRYRREDLADYLKSKSTKGDQR